MTKRRRGADGDAHLGGDRTIDRLIEQLDDALPGLHAPGPRGDLLPEAWPLSLRELYAAFDGGNFYHEQIDLMPAAEVALDDAGRWRIGTCDGDAIAIDDGGRVWRHDPELDDAIVDGSRVDRWLAGALDAAAMLFDGEGEFFADAFDDDGDVRGEVVERQARAQLRRDPKAPGPRWRLARNLLAREQHDLARRELEQVVAEDPEAPWAWLDLALVSEKLGEARGAVDEAHTAAAAAAGGAYEGYFWSQAARLAAAAGDEPSRALAAARALDATPELRTAQLEGARAQLAAGDREGARGLLALLRAIAPRDLDVLALAREVETAVIRDDDETLDS